MKNTIAWIAAEGTTLILAMGAVVMGLAALFNLLGVSSVFSSWFESAYVPALLAVILYALRYVSKAAAFHLLDQHEDQDEALVSESNPVQPIIGSETR